MTPCRRRRVLVTIGAPAVSAALSGSARQPDSSQLTPSREQLAQASPELLELIGSDSFAYFRFINRPWLSFVCERFRDELTSLSTVRLHGDAHIEQYSFTNDARGLDDFDDSALGPSVIDIVRFLGSLDLLVRPGLGSRPRCVVRRVDSSATSRSARCAAPASPRSIMGCRNLSSVSACALRASACICACSS